jgi:hypothetical protein
MTTICRRVSLPPPHLDFYVTQHLKSSVNVETSLRVCCDSHVIRHCWSFILSTRAHDFRSIEQDLPLALSFSLDYLIQEMRMQIDAWSSFINISWFLMILGRRIGIHCRCKLVFLLDYLCPITVWWRVVLVCQWYVGRLDGQGRNLIGESFISNGLGMSSCNRGCSWSYET